MHHAQNSCKSCIFILSTGHLLMPSYYHKNILEKFMTSTYPRTCNLFSFSPLLDGQWHPCKPLHLLFLYPISTEAVGTTGTYVRAIARPCSPPLLLRSNLLLLLVCREGVRAEGAEGGGGCKHAGAAVSFTPIRRPLQPVVVVEGQREASRALFLSLRRCIVRTV